LFPNNFFLRKSYWVSLSDFLSIVVFLYNLITIDVMVRVPVQSGLKSVGVVATIFALVLSASFASETFNNADKSVHAAPLTLSFESVSNTRAVLGTLASRSACNVMTKQGTGPYLMTGTDSLSGSAYSFETDVNYSGAQLNESRESPNTVSYTHQTGQTHDGRSGVLRLQVSGGVAPTGTCNGRQVNTSAFGPEVYTQPFQARAGQALSFNWAAATISGGDDYEIYAFLVAVDGSANDKGSAASSTLLAHGRGKTQGWKTSTGTIPADGYYRFRFVNGSYDASGGTVLGAAMFIDTNVLVGEANIITFGSLSDRVTSSSNQTFAVSATTSSTGLVSFSSSTQSRCTVGASTLTNGVSTATVTVLANQIGLCTISANSSSLGDYATASTVTRSFTILSAPTAPTNSGGTAVSGTAAVGQTLTAVEGSWADGGSAITSTSFLWESCLASSCSWTSVNGATDSSLIVGSSDVGKKFRVKVSKTNNIGTTTVNSSESGTVAKGNQSTLSISSTSATYGQTLELSTTGGSGTGAVTFAKVSGTCTLSGIELVPGDVGSTCVVTATKAGDAAYNPLTTAHTTILVVRASQSSVVVTSVSGTFGSNLSLTATGGSGNGTLSWQVVSGACTVSGSVLTPTAAGDTCIVRATKAADTNYLSRSSLDTAVDFAKAAQTELLEVTTNSLTYGESTTLTASGGSGTGDVTFAQVSGPCSVTGSTVVTSNIGTCVVTATRQSDDNYLAATSVQKSISIGARQLNFSVTALSRKYDGLTAVDLRIGTLNGVINNDSVSVNISRISGRFANADVGDNKVVTLTLLSNLLQGADASKYSYAIPANPRASIEKATQSDLRFTSGSSLTVGDSLKLETSGGQTSSMVTFSTNSTDCRITNGQLTATKGGITCEVVATKAGDARYESTSVAETFTVEKIVQQLTFRSSEPVAPTVGSTYIVSVSSSASLAPTVVIASTSSGVCTIAAEVVTFNAPGTCLISASQSGNDTYSSAAASQSITVVLAPVSPTQNSTVVTGNTVPRPRISQTEISAAPSTTVAPSTTTTAVPNTLDPSRPMSGESGVLPSLQAGVTTAVVQGKTVQVNTITNQDNVTVELPNNVRVVVGATDADGRPLLVGTDGVISLSASNQIRVKMSGLVPGTTYTAFLFSEPVEIGRGVAGPDGTVNALFTVPRELEAGGHTLQVNGVGPDSAVVSVSMGIALQETYNSTPMLLLFIALAMAAALFIPLQMRRKVRLKALLMRR
jgi:hypothetical protein